MKKFNGELDGFTYFFGDKGWIKNKDTWIHKVMTWTPEQGLRTYINGKLELKKKWWEFWK